MGGPGSGRRKAPVEKRRAHGRSPGRDSGGRKLPDPGNVVPLHPVDGDLPPVPASIAPDGPGAARWLRIWRDARWLSPAVDLPVVTRLVELEELRAGMKAALADAGFYVKGSQGQLRPNPLLAQIRATEAQMLQLERECGLTPSSREGKAEVIPEVTNPLTEILKRAANRGRPAAGRR